MKIKSWLLAIGVVSLLSAIGCREQQPIVVEFEPNMVFAYQMSARLEQPMDQALDEANEALIELFGTPDEPKLPESILEEEPLASFLSMDHLVAASGPDTESGRGAYRKHCATCHGVTGNGRGTTAALLDPYPRDYRLGRFKFKSTPIGTKPLKEDIAKLIKVGLPGTAMKAIPELTEQDIDALTDYVIYLSWRGEVERSLLMEAEYLEFAEGDSLYDPSLKEKEPELFEEQNELIQDFALEVAESWLDAPDRVQEVPARDPTIVPDTMEEVVAAMQLEGNSPIKESVARGQELFVSEKTACAKCHGKEGHGDGQNNDYDEWTKDWTERFGLAPDDEYAQVPLIARGALPVRKVSPRNFQEGVYRGGVDPEDIYRRIALGIEGTPMPAAAVGAEEIWDLVNYVRSLYVPEPDELSDSPSAGPSAEQVTLGN